MKLGGIDFVGLELRTREALSFRRLSLQELVLVDCVLRRSFGWGSVTFRVPTQQTLCALTGLIEKDVSLTLRRLEDLRILILRRREDYLELQVSPSADMWDADWRLDRSIVAAEDAGLKAFNRTDQGALIPKEPDLTDALAETSLENALTNAERGTRNAEQSAETRKRSLTEMVTTSVGPQGNRNEACGVAGALNGASNRHPTGAGARPQAPPGVTEKVSRPSSLLTTVKAVQSLSITRNLTASSGSCSLTSESTGDGETRDAHGVTSQSMRMAGPHSGSSPTTNWDLLNEIKAIVPPALWNDDKEKGFNGWGGWWTSVVRRNPERAQSALDELRNRQKEAKLGVGREIKNPSGFMKDWVDRLARAQRQHQEV